MVIGSPEPDADACAPLAVLLTRLHPAAELPSYAEPGDAGADLVSTTDVVLQPGQRAVVGTGVAIALPEGFAAFVHPRSGLAARAGLGIVNGPGTIDAGYRGEIKVILINHDRSEPIRLERGDRIAQLVIQRVERANFVEVDTLPESARGLGGWGSTGGASALSATSGQHDIHHQSPIDQSVDQSGDLKQSDTHQGEQS